MLVVDRRSRTVEHRKFDELPGYLDSGDTLIRNNASVLPARLLGSKSTGGKIECFLLRKVEAPRGRGGVAVPRASRPQAPGRRLL